MACYQILTQSSESTVVAEYIPEKRNAEAYQSEADLEREFIALLKLQGYEYLPIHTETDLIANLRVRIEELNGIKFTDSEWDRFFTVQYRKRQRRYSGKDKKVTRRRQPHFV